MSLEKIIEKIKAEYSKRERYSKKLGKELDDFQECLVKSFALGTQFLDGKYEVTRYSSNISSFEVLTKVIHHQYDEKSYVAFIYNPNENRRSERVHNDIHSHIRYMNRNDVKELAHDLPQLAREAFERLKKDNKEIEQLIQQYC